MPAFTKMQGVGNDFVFLDRLLTPDLPEDLAAFARRIAHRRLGVGADGLVILEQGDSAPFRMRMLNPDGSESEMCGNALRCLHLLAREHGHTNEVSFLVETGAGTLSVTGIDGSTVRAAMGLARLERSQIGMSGPGSERFLNQPICDFTGSAVSMGNPHLVLFVEDVQEVDLAYWGPKLEHDSLFPARVNVHFAHVVDDSHVIQRTWERGAGPTLACGSGACATAVAGFETGRTCREVEIRLPGGLLNIQYDPTGEVFMTGPAEIVFEGEFD